MTHAKPEHRFRFVSAAQSLPYTTAYALWIKNGQVGPQPMASIAEEWWQIIAATAYNKMALAALKMMWEEASSLMPDEKKDSLISWETTFDFLSNYGLTLPD
jgi:hypothetical protein